MRTIFIFSVATFLGTMAATIDEDLEEYDCPPMYDYILPDGPCVLTDVELRATWKDAKYFCTMISGELIVIEDVNFFMNLVNYLEEKGIREDYWIGGHKTQDGNWTWIDDTAMPMGVPFWTVWPHNCYYGDCDFALAPYYPSSRDCATMSSEYFYYFKNEYCSDYMKPLCIFTGTKRHEWEDAEEFE